MSEMRALAEELYALRFKSTPSQLNRRAALGAALAELVLMKLEHDEAAKA